MNIARLLTVCIILSLAAYCQAEPVRVGLVRQFSSASSITIHSADEMSVLDSKDATVKVQAGEQVTLARNNGGIDLRRADGTSVQLGDKSEIVTTGTAISISRQGSSESSFRGKIEAAVDGQGLSLVNVVEVEDYLPGVLPSEMPVGFHPEALKAQAVAARTYAYAGRGRHGKQGYDLCDATHCQVYLGVRGEKAPTTQAVRDTAGLVAVYEGKLISALYSSDCGGMTQDGGKPYLVSVSDRIENGGVDHCERNGHSWTKSWSLPEFEALLRKPFPSLTGIKSMAVSSADGSGRVGEVKIESEDGDKTITGSSLRNLLGFAVIKSTAFTVKVEEGNIVFEGKGFGHGVGLCQFGANGLAGPPNNYTFEQILKHYYRGIEVMPVSQVR